MSDLALHTLNLNLLPALAALLETRSVSAAAKKTHVSQSAMSHTLAKLRVALGDPLLVASGRMLVLTPRASRLAATLPIALDQLAETLAPSQPFDPRTTRRTFRLTTLDYFEIAILGDFMRYLRAHAPHAEVWIERVSERTLPALVAGEIDLALVGEASLPRSTALMRAELYRDPFTVMMRPGHPASRRRVLSLADYLAHPHVVVTVEGRADGAVDRALEPTGKRRDVVLRVPHFATAPLAVRDSDALCTIASSIAERAHALYGLVLRTPPIRLPPASVVAVWSKRANEDEAGRWFRDLFVSGKASSPHVRQLMRAPTS
jgi:DNA-binding transcriptional LysR family regulator